MIQFDPQDVAEVISLFLTIPTICIGLLVVWMWHSAAIETIKEPNKRQAAQWFILGVFVSFLGSCLDNLYWGIAWTLSYVVCDHKDWFFENGVFFNIPFRQISGTIAALCHVRAAIEYKAENGKTETAQKLWKRSTKLIIASFALGLIYVAFLVSIHE